MGEEGEEGEEKMPSCGDYIMHFLTLPWKLIFALIPPTAIANGYPTFVVSIAAVGNVTGSNAVNVFLGIGIAWSMAAIYWEANGEQFKVPVGSLGFSVTVFCIEAGLAILILLARRHPSVGGELGGPKSVKTVTSGI